MKTVTLNHSSKSDHTTPPHHFVHVPPEMGHHAPDLPGYLPHAKDVDHLSGMEHWLVGIIFATTIGIQFWKMTS